MKYPVIILGFCLILPVSLGSCLGSSSASSVSSSAVPASGLESQAAQEAASDIWMVNTLRGPVSIPANPQHIADRSVGQ